MGKFCPPFYGEEDILKIINDISDIDIKINELMLQREEYVKALKEKLNK